MQIYKFFIYIMHKIYINTWLSVVPNGKNYITKKQNPKFDYDD